jgi:hypothetical protein
MVSMHGVGLPQQRYGTMPSMSKRVDEYSLKFIEEREPSHKLMMNQIATLERYAGASGPDQIQFNYRMMQVFDRLSLFFCANFDIVSVPASGSHSQGKAYYGPTITPTPVQFDQPDSELCLRAVDRSAVIAEPYPFDEAPLRVGVRGRLIPRIAYKSQEEFREVYSKAPREVFEFTLEPA